MANKLPDGKKLVVELTNEGYRNVFFKNKWGDFLNYVQKIGLGRTTNVPKGVAAFLVDEEGAGVSTVLGTVRSPVTQADIDRQRELAETPDVPDTTDLPAFQPFGDVEPSDESSNPEEELVDSESAKALLDKVQPKVETGEEETA